MKKIIKSGVVKFSILSLGLLFINASASAGGPVQDLSKTVISFEISHGSLKQAFRIIESETHLLFTFKTNDVLRYTNLNYSSPSIAVDKLLNILLTGTDLGYQQMENNIIIKKNSVHGDPSPGMDLSFFVAGFDAGVHGKITNEKGEPVAGASISVEGQNKGAAADAAGEFSLHGLKAGTYQIHVSAVGYTTESPVGYSYRG